MPFFLRNKPKKQKPVKRTIDKFSRPEPISVKRSKKDEEIDSDSDASSDLANDNRPLDLSSEEEFEETAQGKKIRLAKQYIERIKKEEAEKLEDREIDDDIISARLRQDSLQKAQKFHYQRADKLLCPSEEVLKVLRGHQLSVTCLVVSSDDKYIYSASKDSSIIKWDVSTLKKVQTLHGGRKGTEKTHIGHTTHILCLALSTDSKYLASGDNNNLIYIWDPATFKHIQTFKGHRGAVSGLAFRKGSHQLYSASHDRSVRIWNLDEMSYVETLFGHQDNITGIDSLTRERCVTSGGRDASIRIWKIVEESQLVFNTNRGSADCVALIDESSFITGHDNNVLCLWNVTKKKPAFTRMGVHGEKPEGGKHVREENWVTAVASLQYSDVVASGSKDGCVRFWKVGPDLRYLSLLFKVPVKGFVNSLKFSNDGKFLVAGVGQEHRLGRWWRLKEARNSVCIIPLTDKLAEAVNTPADAADSPADKLAGAVNTSADTVSIPADTMDTSGDTVSEPADTVDKAADTDGDHKTS